MMIWVRPFLDTYVKENSTLEFEQHTNNPYHGLEAPSINALLGIPNPDGTINLDADKEAARRFFLDHVNQNTVFFHTLKEKLDYLVENDYYEHEFLEKYSEEFIKNLYKRAYGYKHRFQSYLGALKYYTSYTLKTFDGERYLERYEDRVTAVALYLADGDETQAEHLVDEIMSGRFQPATPTFLNAGKKQRGELTSCFLLEVGDDMKAIGRAIQNALELSKRGGGVAFNLSNLRETGAPIKKIQNQSSGVVPVMKLLEDAFSYANQLGARQGAGSVSLSVHHPDIMRFLDTKRENADEKIRIKTLSVGVVMTDKMVELVTTGDMMYTFSPYDVERIYGVPFADVNISEEYDKLVENPEITKYQVDPRKLWNTIAELQFESGYPYIMFEDTVNRRNPIHGKIKMSNLCHEILQVQTQSTFDSEGHYDKRGRDISCNLGSMNIAHAMKSPDFGGTVETAVRSLTAVSDMADFSSVPSIKRGNQLSHAIGLGQMNMHGFLGSVGIPYDSEEALDFTNIYFYTVAYHAIRTSNLIARERGEVFYNFEKSTYASGEFFTKYVEGDFGVIKTEKVRELVENSNLHPPTREDWARLRDDVMVYGLYNQNLQAIPPTGSISYINGATSSIHPVAAQVEVRKEGRVGRVHFAAPGLTNENQHLFEDAYSLGPEPIIRLYAAAQEHIDQGLSLTLFFNDTASAMDLIAAQHYAYKQGIGTLYYVRLRRSAVPTSECESCTL